MQFSMQIRRAVRQAMSRYEGIDRYHFAWQFLQSSKNVPARALNSLFHVEPCGSWQPAQLSGSFFP